MTGTNGQHPFTEAMEQACRVLGGKPSDWHVQSDERDPFYIVASEANQRDGFWMREQWDDLGIAKPSYPRGSHYSLIGAPMPEGIKRVKATKRKTGEVIDYRLPEWDHRFTTYENTAWHADFSENALKVGPWVGAFPFWWVFERRNRDGIKRIVVPQDAPQAWVEQFGADEQVADLRGIALPDAEELRPMAAISRFVGRADDSTPDFEGSPDCPAEVPDRDLRREDIAGADPAPHRRAVRRAPVPGVGRSDQPAGLRRGAGGRRIGSALHAHPVLQ